LFCVLVEADRRLSADDRAGGLELISAVRRDPACRNSELAEIDRIVEQSGLTEEPQDRGIERPGVDDVVEALLGQSGDGP
jgi:hypothetical protein